jgi:DNA integrity scanning protein DisA with diadenylate cyclase activity
MQEINVQQTNQGEVSLSQLGGLKEPMPEPEPQPQELPPPAFTNEQFVNLIAPIVYDAAAGDLPPEILAHMPSPAILKAVLDLIGFERASGMLNSAVQLDPKKTLLIGLGATAAWSAWVVFKATAIKQQLKKEGKYQSALEQAAQAKREAYEELKRQMDQARGENSGTPEGN